MQVTSEQLGPCKVEIKVEIEPEKVAEAYDRAYKEFAKYTNVPGFRKGKAPRQILERYVSDESLRREVTDLLVTEAYPEALEQEKIEPYAAPEVNVEELEEGKPMIFKAAVPLAPKVELGEYKGIEVERPKVEVTDADVDDQLKYLQDERATAEKVEGRGMETGDIAIAEIASAVEGQEMGAPKRTLVHTGDNVPGFDEAILGQMPGERRTFELTYPADYQEAELAGKNAAFDVNLESIRIRKVPELNDEFAKELGGFESMDQLKEDIRKHVLEAREADAEKEVERKIVEQIVARSDISVPDVLVDHEVEHDLHDMRDALGKRGTSLDAYLKRIEKNRDELMAELRESALGRVKTGLALGEICDKENIDVSDADVEAEIERTAEESKATKESVEAYIDTRGGRPALKNNLLDKKVLDYLKSVSKIK